MPTSRLQKIITKPATAANTEAMGISVSGPIYKQHPSPLEVLRHSGTSFPACTVSGTSAAIARHKPTRQLYCVYLAAGTRTPCCRFAATGRIPGLQPDSARFCDCAESGQANAPQTVTLTHPFSPEPSE
jgi:hypothetical protein